MSVNSFLNKSQINFETNKNILTSDKLSHFLINNYLETHFLVIDLDTITDQVRAFIAVF